MIVHTEPGTSDDAAPHERVWRALQYLRLSYDRLEAARAAVSAAGNRLCDHQIDATAAIAALDEINVAYFALSNAEKVLAGWPNKGGTA